MKWSSRINSTQIGGPSRKKCACPTGVVRFRSASVALCSSRREKKGRFVQRRIIPRLARSRTKACVSDSALTYTVFTQSSQWKGAQQRASFGTQAESSVVSHLNKHDYETIGGVKYLIPGICPPQLPTFLYIPSDSYGTNTQHPGWRHQRHTPCDVIRKFLSASLSSWRTNPRVGHHLSRWSTKYKDFSETMKNEGEQKCIFCWVLCR